jgi:hypothetical protein
MIREVACPADSAAPLHLADYDTEAQSLLCARCGRLSTPELVAALGDEMHRFELENPGLAAPPSLAADESTAKAIALKLFNAFPAEAVFAAEAAEALAVQTLADRLPRAHVVNCIAAAFRSFKAAA